MENSYKRILDRVVLSEESEKKLLAIPDLEEQEKKPEKKIIRLQTKIVAAAAVLVVVLISAGVWQMSRMSANRSKDAVMPQEAAEEQAINGDWMDGEAKEDAAGALPGQEETRAGEPQEAADMPPEAAGVPQDGAGVPAEGAQAEEEYPADDGEAKDEAAEADYNDYPVFYGNTDGFTREILEPASNELAACLYTDGSRSIEVRLYTAAECLPSAYRDKTFALPDGVSLAKLKALSAIEETDGEYDFAGDDGYMIIRYHFAGFTPEEVLAVLCPD